ncbi:hypothetical protein HYH03_011176 [Edaphochlamys debaryana]|uniref:HYR domain-containing protein n=1 Tax=Edaphochlamys debaryana TaxID=47281 RepID=A0A836BWQ8_9CHLO|nr:hypothetical protein HYH03_011176 [Edaphochlamys debaryana]|eukprot:KAG2490374.1 hypothetical protein HYH03_011176 [Edaphochlamys debaryana]
MLASQRSTSRVSAAPRLFPSVPEVGVSAPAAAPTTPSGGPDPHCLDLGNVIALEHVNLEVPDLEVARLFYAEGLGLTADPGTTGQQRGGAHVVWYNCGRQQVGAGEGTGVAWAVVYSINIIGGLGGPALDYIGTPSSCGTYSSSPSAPFQDLRDSNGITYRLIEATSPALMQAAAIAAAFTASPPPGSTDWKSRNRVVRNHIPVTLRLTAGISGVFVDHDFMLFVFTSRDADTSNTLTARPGVPLPDGASLSDTSGGSPLTTTLTWTPTTAQQGTSGTFQLVVNDITNLQATASFNWRVRDSSPPTVTVPSSFTAGESNLPGGGRLVTFTGVSAVDSIDGSRPTTCSPDSGAVFPVGVTTVTCSATDSSGNANSATFTVTVLPDTTAPAITVPGDISAEGDALGGKFVSFSSSAEDTVDGDLPTNCIPPSGSLFPVGINTVECTAEDNSGNTVSGSFTVTIADTTAPELTVPGAISAEGDALGGKFVSFSSSAEDIVDGDLPTTCTPPSGSLFPVGISTVECTAEDNSGNTVSGTFTVTIAWCNFGDGFLPPVENSPGVNVITTTQTLPLKWSMGGGYWGMNILAPGSPTLHLVPCASLADPTPTDLTQSVVTADSTELKWIADEGRYQLGYSMRSRVMENSCYQLRLTLRTCPSAVRVVLLRVRGRSG